MAAIRAAQLGRRVTLVDSNPPGGTCLHRGCIPLKALLAASERYHQARAGLEGMGISAGLVSFDWSQMNAWKQGIVGKLFGVRYLATLLGVSLAVHQLGGFYGAWLGGVAVARFGYYSWMWYADALLATAAAICNLPIREAKVARATAPA